MRFAGFFAIVLALALPAAAIADKPVRPGSHAAGKDRGQVAIANAAGRCPPGLAKKSPACVPPGQARHGLVGSVVDWSDVHVVRKPGLYGLANAPNGQRYAIVNGKLVRIDSGTAKVLSVIRAVDSILD